MRVYGSFDKSSLYKSALGKNSSNHDSQVMSFKSFGIQALNANEKILVEPINENLIIPSLRRHRCKSMPGSPKTHFENSASTLNVKKEI